MDLSLLRGVFDGCTQAERQQTLQYFEHLKSTSDAWKLCMGHFTENSCDDPVLFFCLQVLEHHVRNRHSVSSDEDIFHLRQLLLTWFNPNSIVHSFKFFIKNKMAQIFSLVFISDYPLKWPQFFNDVLSLFYQHSSVYTFDIYLRTLLAIDSEIVDRDIIHSHEDNVRNTLIKDTIRDTCAGELVETWLSLLSSHKSLHHEILCQTMSVIGHYITWMDISLIANDKFIGLLLGFLTEPALREHAADCLHDIINKGMEPIPKLELVESLVQLLEETGVLIFEEVNDENVDFQAKMSRLYNGIGNSLIVSYNKLLKNEDEINAQLVLDAIYRKVPYMLRYLVSEYDDVSENVIPFATQYVTVLKHLNLSDDNRQSLQLLLNGIVKKLKYDVSYNFANPGEEEGLFMEYRNKLHILFDNLSQVDMHLVMTNIQTLVGQTIQSYSNRPFYDVEVALLMFHYISEINFERIFGTSATLGSPFSDIMLMLMNSEISHHQHSTVLLQYYEVVLRHDKFFAAVPQYIPRVMEGFLDHRGLHHPSAAVRSRLAYQFLRFVKSIRNHLGDMAEDILKRIEDLLMIEFQSSESLISPNDTIFLYEAVGYLVVHSSTTPEGKYQLMRSIHSPLLNKYSYHLNQLCSLTITQQQQEDITQFLYYILSYMSRTSKVFLNYKATQQNGCVSCYVEALPVILQGLELPAVLRDKVQSGIRQYLHRGIICLGDELLDYVPLAVSLMLKDAELSDIQELIPLINQLITKYKSRIAPFIQEVFMFVIQTITSCTSQPYDPLDVEECRDRMNLQKSYYLFINSLCINGVTEVIYNLGSEQLYEVLQTVIDGARTSSDPSVKKICIMSLKRLVEIWGVSGCVDGFMDFCYKEVLPVCFHVPLQRHFDVNEAQSFLCLGEIAGLLKGLVNCGGNEFLLYLQNHYLISLNIHLNLIQELLVKLQEVDTKSLKPYLKAFFLNLRTNFNFIID